MFHIAHQKHIPDELSQRLTDAVNSLVAEHEVLRPLIQNLSFGTT